MKKILSITMSMLLLFLGANFTKANAQEIKVTDFKTERKIPTLGETFSVKMTVSTTSDAVYAEDLVLNYDTEKLNYEGYEEIEGFSVYPVATTDSSVRFRVANKTPIESYTTQEMIQLNFSTTTSGQAYIENTCGKISNAETERDLRYSERGKYYFKISKNDIDDVNGDGEFTLVDLAIDAKHFGKYVGNVDTTDNIDLDGDRSVTDKDIAIINEYIDKNDEYLFK